ncbi:MAG: FAD-binding oxidoreductase [Chloroflexota bacterium]|nr:MAG: FAD-binding oxidoreductase [Chloroflexota bacterium]
MSTPTAPATRAAIDRLRATLRGRVITPADPEYDTARTIMLGGTDPRPAVIARVADAGDVAAAIAAARDHGLELAVRAGGHSGAGHGSADDGLVIDLRDLKTLDIDAETRSTWAGAGLTAGEVTPALAEHGLGLGFGDTGSVGISGITLGGGIGYLVRKHGLTIDNLLGVEIVTADGRILQVDATTHPDLFWAIRGGGGNFGVVTRLRYRLHPLGTVVGGILVLPATPETVAGFIAAAEAAPEELSTIANVMPAPPMPFLPEAVHGQLVILAMMVYAGDVSAGAAVYAPFRALATAHADLVREMAYPEMFPPADDSYHPTAVSHTLFLDRVDRPAAGAIMDHLRASDAPFRFAQLRVLGGAMARVPADATAFAHRSSRIMAVVGAFYETAEERKRREAWLAELLAAIRQEDQGAYVNFLTDEGEARVRAAYPGPTWDRLAAVKAAYDPTNLFHRNQNIPPAATA